MPEGLTLTCHHWDAVGRRESLVVGSTFEATIVESEHEDLLHLPAGRLLGQRKPSAPLTASALSWGPCLPPSPGLVIPHMPRRHTSR